jgi:uncharacterized protein YbaR (Trm112 family)
MPVTLDQRLLDILACPACKSPLRVEDALPDAPGEIDGELLCTGCGLAYPVREGIPVLLVDEGRPTR